MALQNTFNMKVNYNIFQIEGSRLSVELMNFIKTLYTSKKIITRDYYMLQTTIALTTPTTIISYALIVLQQQCATLGYTHIMILV